VKEILIVLSLAKPGVDAIRVASGAEKNAGAPLDPFTELMIGKALEIALESGPGAALQAYILLSGDWSTSAVVSVGISCIATGFTTAMMAFDMDTNPARRKGVPEFNGFIPDRSSKRILIFVELFAYHTAHAMVKTFTIAMLGRSNWRWLFAYLAADHCVFISYKIVLGDLHWFMPGTSLKRGIQRAN
jgi:hypothetical protein